jgi:hypothetical protein
MKYDMMTNYEYVRIWYKMSRIAEQDQNLGRLKRTDTNNSGKNPGLYMLINMDMDWSVLI